MKRVVTSIDSKQFRDICDGVWRDRGTLVRGRGFLSGEAALIRAVYWRLRKTGVRPTVSAENYLSPQTISAYHLGVSCLLELSAHPHFDGVPFLKELVARYQNEIGVLVDKREST